MNAKRKQLLSGNERTQKKGRIVTLEEKVNKILSKEAVSSLEKEPGFPRDKTTDDWGSWETKSINYESFVAVLV